MIFFGTNARSIKKGQLNNVDCPNCKNSTTMRYSIFGKYFHLYWIPVFPLKQLPVSECNSCKQSFGYVDIGFNDTIRKKLLIEKERNLVRYPFWMYTGSFLIIALFGFGFYSMYETKVNNALFIKNPKVGDVYYTKLNNGHFSTMRVDKTSRTEVYVTNNDYEIDSEFDVSNLDESKNYTKFKDTLTVLELQQHFNNENIIEINRKE